jgi:hypothetical protein
MTLKGWLMINNDFIPWKTSDEEVEKMVGVFEGFEDLAQEILLEGLSECNERLAQEVLEECEDLK